MDSLRGRAKHLLNKPRSPSLGASSHRLATGATAPDEQLGNHNMSSHFRFLIALIAFACVLNGTGHLGHSADKKKSTVTVTIDFGDGFQKRYTSIPWKSKMTVMDATQAATKHKRGIKIKYRGRRATAFLFQIDDLKNEGRGKNWLYSVNGKLGDRSFALFPVKAGDTVLWKFRKYK